MALFTETCIEVAMKTGFCPIGWESRVGICCSTTSDQLREKQGTIFYYFYDLRSIFSKSAKQWVLLRSFHACTSLYLALIQLPTTFLIFCSSCWPLPPPKSSRLFSSLSIYTHTCVCIWTHTCKYIHITREQCFRKHDVWFLSPTIFSCSPSPLLWTLQSVGGCPVRQKSQDGCLW